MFGTTTFTLLLLPAAPIEADYVIRGATLHDGSGKPGVVGDLAIKGDRIVAVGAVDIAGKPKIIDGKGLIVAPGFIDLHSHSDIGFYSPGSKVPIVEPKTKSNLNFLTKGVTTIVTGNCGFGPVDVAAYLKQVDASQPGSNVVPLVPHNDLRKAVMGNANRGFHPGRAGKDEDAGGPGHEGWRLGPGDRSLLHAGKLCSDRGGNRVVQGGGRPARLYATHMRDEGTGLLASIHETLRIGREAKLPVHISHLKAWGRKSWDKAPDAIALIEEARSKGQVVTADQYPYIAASTWLAAFVIPVQFRDGTQQDLIARFDDAEQGPKIRKAIEQLLVEWDGGKTIRIASYAKKPEWQGKNLAAIAVQEKKTALEIVLEIERQGGASAVNFAMNEEAVRLVMKQPFVATASDGGTMVVSDTFTHPRSYGTFPRKIGRYSLEEKVVSLEQALRSASGLPADILHLPERGYLKPGYFADVVIFDAAKFRDQATFEKPHQYATGVKYLFVNGKLTIDQEKFTAVLAGKAMRHKAEK